MNKLGNLALRKVVLNNGADFVFTEMIRIEKLLEGDEVQLRKSYVPQDMKSKTIYQIICEDIDNIEKGVDFLVKQNPEIFEINYNMGCPQSSLCKNECGGGIVKNPAKVKEVAKRLAKACSKYKIRPSIKTRIGYTRDNINIRENVSNIKDARITKIYIHGRVLREPYSKPATYDEIKTVVENFPELEIIGNGDVRDMDSLNAMIKTGCSGILIGRAVLENPYLFKDLKEQKISSNALSGIELKSRKKVILEYLKYAKEFDLNDSYIKSNLAYMTNKVIKGAEFRKQLNNITDVDAILKLCEDL